jgi:hypothetical protein
MKRLMLAFLLLSGIALVGAGYALSGSKSSASPAAAADRNDGAACSNRTYRGRYGFVFDGQTSPADTAVPTTQGVNTPLVATGFLDSDGRGHWTGVVYTNPPGSANVVDGESVGSPFTALYRVRPDCTGFARVTIIGAPGTVPPPTNFAFVLVDVNDGVAQRSFFNANQLGTYGTGETKMISGGDED